MNSSHDDQRPDDVSLESGDQRQEGHSYVVEQDQSGTRLDKFLSDRVPSATRSLARAWLTSGWVLVDEQQQTVDNARRRLSVGQVIKIYLPPPDPEHEDQPEKIALQILYQDEDLVVINKPAGLVVHPGAGCPRHTLLNALLHWRPDLRQLPRAGIVHRLDRDTSGLMLVALNQASVDFFTQAFKLRQIQREYLAIVHGVPVVGGTIDAPLARHNRQRTRFAVHRSGRSAISHFRVLRRYSGYALLAVQLATGRTHQIRVHLQHIGYPVVGDRQYGGRRPPSVGLPASVGEMIRATERQMLHSWKITFLRPHGERRISVTSRLPDDMRDRLGALNAGRSSVDAN